MFVPTVELTPEVIELMDQAFGKNDADARQKLEQLFEQSSEGVTITED